MKPVKRKAPKTQNPVCNEETPPSPPPPQASLPQRFSALAAKYVWKMTENWMMVASQATKEMKTTLILLIMTVAVVTVMMTCRPDYRKHEALTLLDPRLIPRVPQKMQKVEKLCHLS